MAADLGRLPFPVAHPAQRVSAARSASDQLAHAGHSIEMTAVTLGVLTLGWCRSRHQATNAVHGWEQAVARKGMALGGWVTLLTAVRPAMAGASEDPLAHAVGRAIEAVLPRLRGYTPTRNQHAHGGRPRIRAEEEAAASDLVHRARTVLDSIDPLAGVRIGVVRDCVTRSGNRYEVDLDVFTGYAETPSVERLTSRRALAPGVVVVYPDRSLEYAAELAPFCIYHECRVCRRDELFYLTKRTNSRGDHFAFATGHKLQLSGDRAVKLPSFATVGLAPLGARRTQAVQGWRAVWTDLAPRRVRLAARALDTVVAFALAAATASLAILIGMPTLWCVLVAMVAALAVEPVAAWTGGTLGKRLFGIQAISTWDCRPLGHADALRRALFVNLQLLVWPLAIPNAAWVLWDPARQALHDRRAASIVVTGRSRKGHRR